MCHTSKALIPSSPTDRPPSGPGWVHEIKHDGFRMMVRWDPAGVRVLPRRGHDWTSRFSLIAQAAVALKARSFLLDGEAVACDQDGRPSFDRLRHRRGDGTVFLYAFDLLELKSDRDLETDVGTPRSARAKPHGKALPIRHMRSGCMLCNALYCFLQ